MGALNAVSVAANQKIAAVFRDARALLDGTLEWSKISERMHLYKLTLPELGIPRRKTIRTTF
jgi:hypothetical protein